MSIIGMILLGGYSFVVTVMLGGFLLLWLNDDMDVGGVFYWAAVFIIVFPWPITIPILYVYHQLRS